MDNVKSGDSISLSDFKCKQGRKGLKQKKHPVKEAIILITVIIAVAVLLLWTDYFFQWGIFSNVSDGWKGNTHYQAGNQEHIELDTLPSQKTDSKQKAIAKTEWGVVKEKDIESGLEKSALLDLKWINQCPELPTGCEITALTTVMNYDGFEVSKETMAEKYLEKASTGSFYDKFIGDPFTSYGYGCYSDAIVKAANLYFKKNNCQAQAIDLTGIDFKNLLSYVRQGYPVIVWNTINMAPAYETAHWEADGEELVWIAPEHCVVLMGFDLDQNTVTISDPLVGIVERDMDIFEERYESLSKQAVYITLN